VGLDQGQKCGLASYEASERCVLITELLPV
jgi:hypothetical protein